MPTRNKKNPRKSMRVTTSQSVTSGKNNAHFLSHNLPVYALEKKFIGISSILARRKCRLLPTETTGMSLLSFIFSTPSNVPVTSALCLI